MRRFSIVFVYALALYAGISHAGTFIGNGGGIGELQARRALEDLNDIAEHCRRRPESCAHIQKAAAALSCAQALYPDWVEIDFDKAEAAAAHRWDEGNFLVVASNALYSAGVPKTFEEISVFIYEAVLGEAGGMAKELYARFKRVTSNFVTRVNWREISVRLMTSSEFSDQLVLEAEKEAYDLNSLLGSLPRCGSVRATRVQFDQLNWTAPGRNSTHLSGKISFSCGAVSMTGDFHMFLPFDEHGLLKEKNVTVTFTYLH